MDKQQLLVHLIKSLADGKITLDEATQFLSIVLNMFADNRQIKSVEVRRIDASTLQHSDES